MTVSVVGCDEWQPLVLAYPVQCTPLVPNMGVNYPNWVMVPFDSGNGLFLYSTRIDKRAQEKTGPTVALKLIIIIYHKFLFNWVCNRNKWAFRWKKLLFVHDWEAGVTTQRRGAILGNRWKKVEKHCCTATDDQVLRDNGHAWRESLCTAAYP